ncbi:helix-turn-helix domain-containing protein [Niallia sp. MER 6]|uniref:helix-turn-helix domain-containing protein n=1 Tax=Niallia sp. MER 6 TaxID=2939567 RepID=UPI00203D4916|nr:helix-turn-helix transcriptional regulator [Niallia sp. MER 6]MCM3032537.1 helix-turn-helix domain-containing protein [Niallia sp. MER 6]
MNEFNKALGKNINNYRKAINMSTTTLSELSGVSQGTISKIENGNSTTNIETLLKICQALGVTLYDVIPENFLPETKIDNPNKMQVLNILNKMSDSELKLVQAFLTTNILPTLKSITPLVKALDQLNDEERKYLSTFFDSITNN